MSRKEPGVGERREPYYNDIDAKVCARLARRMDAGLVARGEINSNSICDVEPKHVQGRTAHFFCGGGAWDHALQLAGWPADRPVWTGSCPCQPFSSAGKRRAQDDERDLWPAFFDLIRECRPPVIFGEQVASAEVVGSQQEADFVVAVQAGNYAKANKLARRLSQKRGFGYQPRWVDRVQADLEGAGYAFRFDVLGAHSVGAPHIRQRLYWVAVAHGGERDRHPADHGEAAQGTPDRSAVEPEPGGRCGRGDGLGDAGSSRSQEQRGRRHEPPRPAASVWDDCALVRCVEPTKDGGTKEVFRRAPVEPGVFPLAHGVPGRVELLKEYGNAIVPQVAAVFIRASMGWVPAHQDLN